MDLWSRPYLFEPDWSIMGNFEGSPITGLCRNIFTLGGSKVYSQIAIMVLLTMQALGVSDGKADFRIECLADRHLVSGNEWKGYTLHNISLPTLGTLEFTIALPIDAYLAKCCQKLQLRFTIKTLTNVVPPSTGNEGGYFLPHVEWTLCTSAIRLFNCYGYTNKTLDKFQSPDKVYTGKESSVSTKTPLTGSWWFVLQHCIRIAIDKASYEVGTFGQSGLSAANAPRYGGEMQIARLDNIHVPKVKISSTLPCLIEGKVDTTARWHGYLAKMSVPRDSSISYRFLLTEAEPSNEALLTVLFYSQEDIKKFSASDSCQKKVSVLESVPNSHKILPLSIGNVWSGCAVESVNGIPTYTCQGGRNVGEEHVVYIAVANCQKQSGLKLYYVFEFQNYDSDCPGSSAINKGTGIHVFFKCSIVCQAQVALVLAFTSDNRRLDL